MHRHLNYINLPRIICQHLLGKNHQTHHRIAAGGMIMVTGIIIASSGHVCEIIIFKATLDFIGYSLHGLGLVPMIEWLLEEDDNHPPTAGVCGVTPAMCANR